MKNPFTSSLPSPLYRGRTLFLAVALSAGLAACATTPQVDTPEPAATAVSSDYVTAFELYNAGNFSGAVSAYNDTIGNENASANSRRMAHLGKVLIYLGTDENWFSLDNAKISLRSAGEVAPTANEEFKIETDMLMDALSSMIGTESEIAELQRKAGNYKGEIAGLKQERDALIAERDALLEEQEDLNKALEKLKKLTLGE